ncbi:hypothetical protein M409DRAFT_29154 [Zasmidium cellare ATCC 36951]|uniref:F-box domain-containing protein n=1 Tax=Zasmidium cellare ATCC 36951 TaxID=1080233 RepID=A0A6A6C2A0_ZASCE|nr:uncharacterized protein M409DRAFT_29154 [Zasmidium cellare ATCC 36951]KAF2160300.1 hypothetical protein M409DRAFT_29154 [Zasmidium cellare ATCC 36951]
MSFDDLPAETLVNVGSSLETSSLLSFGLVNRACRAAAVPSIYRSIVLYIGNPHTLASDVAKFDRAWTQADAFRHFRSLDIQGFSIPDGVDLNSTGGKNGKKAYSMSWRVGHDAKRRASPGTFPYLEGNIQEDDKFDWQPLADTLRKFRGLEHLTFGMAQQFLPCLLEVLHSSLQKCELEIRCFSLRSLRDEVVDPYEYELVTSPNLISVHTCYTYLEEDGGYDVGDLNDLTWLR